MRWKWEVESGKFPTIAGNFPLPSPHSHFKINYLLKENLTFLFLFLSFTAVAQQQQIDFVLKETKPLSAVLLQLEQENGLLFSFKEEDVREIMIDPVSIKGELSLGLEQLLKNSGLDFKLVDKQFVVLIKKEEQTPSETLSMCGKILDSYTNESLPGANIRFKNSQRGTVSQSDGQFVLEMEVGSTDSLLISYVGYQEACLPTDYFVTANCPEVRMKYIDFGEDFVVVTDYLTDGVGIEEQGTYVELQPNKVGALPGQVEPDVLATVQFLPGVTSCDGSLSGICIQGGTPDQNLILWEDIPVYHSAHYFGMISAFNPYIINNVAVYRGGFGADYGGRIAGVIDMKSELNSYAENKFGVGTNLMNGYTYGRFKTRDKKLSVVYSLRRSMTEIWRSPTFENITRKVQQGVLVQNLDLNRLPDGIIVNDEFNFLDANLTATYQVSEKDKIKLSAFLATNDFESLIVDNNITQRQEDTFDLKSNALNLSWDRKWSKPFSSKIAAHLTDYSYDYTYSVINQNNDRDTKGKKNSSIKEQQIHWSNELLLPRQHKIKAGYQLTNYDVDFKVAKNKNGNMGSNANSDFLSNLHVVYATFSTSKENSFGLDAGLRFNHYEQLDAQYWEPRLRLWYNVPQVLNVYFNVGRYYQYLSQIIQVEGDRANIDTPVWGLTGSKKIPVLNSLQYQVGFMLRKNTWLLDVQSYHKEVNGLSSLATGFDEGLSNKFHLGDGTVRGLDVLLKKRWGDFRSWVSYSVSEIEHEFPTFFDQRFPGPTDERHVFNWANQWTIGKFECSLGWKYSSGRTHTNKDFFDVLEVADSEPGPREIVVPVVNEFNSERLSAQHQLDASVLYKLIPKNSKKGQGTIGLSLYNIYHHRNVYSREMYIDKRGMAPPRLEYVDRVGLGFTPNFVFRWEW